MARKEATLTVCGITQYLQPEYWKWQPAELQALALGAKSILEVIVAKLEIAGCVVESAYGIIHDKDEHRGWDEIKKELVTELKPPHIHTVIRFKKGKGALLSEIASAVGVEAQYVEKAGRGRFAHDNMVAYLTHAKYPEKFQYLPDEVATVRGDDYLGIDVESRDRWIKGRASIKMKKAEENVDDLLDRVLQGELSREQIVLTDDLYETYARHRRVIDEALETYALRRAMIAAQKLKNGEFSTQVVFITGKSGVGKSRFADELASKAVENADYAGERWSVYRAATTNPLDSWAGEEIILLDDLRAGAMGATDWLLLLDPHRASPASARYKNKENVAPRLIILTSVFEPEEYFFYVRQKGNVDEALDQFIRRLSALVRVHRIGDEIRYDLLKSENIGPRFISIQGEPVGMSYGFVLQAAAATNTDAGDVLLQELRRRSADLALPAGSVATQQSIDRVSQFLEQIATQDFGMTGEVIDGEIVE